MIDHPISVMIFLIICYVAVSLADSDPLGMLPGA